MKNNIKYISVFISILFYIPLVMSRSNYIDDVYRSASANPDYWFENARPLAVWFYRIINQGFLAPDLSPLTVIISFIIMSLAAKTIADRIALENKVLWSAIFVVFMCNPMFLSNLSYKFDAPTMALAVCLSTFAALKERSVGISDFAMRCIILFAMFCSYQPALGVFIGLIPIYALCGNKKDITITGFIKSCTYLTSVMILTFIIYKLTIVPAFLNDKYITASSSVSMDVIGLKVLIFNALTYLSITTLFTKTISVCILIAVGAISLTAVLFERGKVGVYIFIMALPFVVISFLSPNIALNTPAFNVREINGFSIFFILLLIIINEASRKSKYNIVMLSSLLFIIPSLCLSYSFLNYKDSRAKRDEYIGMDIKNTMYHFGVKNFNEISIANSADVFMNAQNSAAKAYPLINKLRGGDTFDGIWYGVGILTREQLVHKKISKKAYTDNKTDYVTCTTKAYLESMILHIKIGKYC